MSDFKNPLLDPVDTKKTENFLDEAEFSAPVTFFKFDSEEQKFKKTENCDIFFFKVEKEKEEDKILRIVVVQSRLFVRLDFFKTFDCEETLAEENFVLKFTAIDDNKLVVVACKFSDLSNAQKALEFFK